MLGNSHRVDNHRLFAPGVKPGGLDENSGRDTSYLCNIIRGVIPDRFLQFFKPFRPLLDVFSSVESLSYDHIHHPVYPGHVGPVILAEVNVGGFCQFDIPGVRHDQRGRPVPDRVDDPGSDQGVLRGCIRTGHQKAVGVLELLNRVGHGAGTERCFQAHHRGGVTEPGAMIDIVCLEDRPGQLHHKEVFLVGGLGGTQES